MTFDPLYLSAGDLRHSVTIQSANKSERDSYGQPISTWATILTTRAKIASTVGASYKDAFAQNALANQSTHLITIRYPSDAITIQPGQRVTHKNDTYTIQDVDNVLERNRVLRIACMQIESTSN